MKSTLHVVAPATENRTVTPRRRPNAEIRTREHLTETEVEKLIKAAGKNRWGHRDATMILVAYRHGLRVSELVDLRWDQVDFAQPALHVRRVKQGTPATHPILRRRNAGFAETAARAGPQIAVRVHHRTRLAVLYERLCQACGARWRGCQAWASRPTRICCGTPAGSRWPTRGTIRGPCRPTSGTRISSTPCGTPSFRRLGSRISGSRMAPSGAVHRLSFRRSGRDALLERDQNPPGIPGQEEPSLGRNGSGGFRLRRWLREY